jgi:ketosteroid isomerase-like protein
MRLTMPLAAFSATAAFLFTASPALHASPQAGRIPPADAKKAIQQNYNAMNAAMGKKDVKGTLAYFAPDFVQITSKGQRIPLEAMRSGLEQMVGQMKAISGTTVVSKVTLDGTGKKASATVRNTLKMTVTNPNTGKDAKIVGIEDSVDT